MKDTIKAEIELILESGDKDVLVSTKILEACNL